MSLIFIECLFLSACLIFLIGINPFVKKWKNLALYFSKYIFYFVSFICFLTLFQYPSISLFVLHIFNFFCYQVYS